jgi:hypothetical protein
LAWPGNSLTFFLPDTLSHSDVSFDPIDQVRMGGQQIGQYANQRFPIQTG